MTFDWHMLYPLHTVIFDNSQVFGGVPCKAQLCNFSKWFFSPRFGVVPIWELWQFCYVRIEPPKAWQHVISMWWITMVPGHCVGSCTPSTGLPYPPCTMRAVVCTILRLLRHCGSG